MSDRSARMQPATSAAAITPADNGNIIACRALWVGGAGAIKVDFRNGGTAITISGVPAGSLLPFDVSRVYATDTTATAIVAVY